MSNPTCYCAAYKFPHRKGSGSCVADKCSDLCSDCRLPCLPVEEDFGIGPYECHGAKGWHTDLQEVSDCCGAEVVKNTYQSFKETA